MASRLPPTEVATTIEIPIALRVQLDQVRIARAQRAGHLTPPLKSVVREALEIFVASELHV